MIRPTAHQVVAARRSPLRLRIIFEKAHDEERTFIMFEGSHPKHGLFRVLVEYLADDVLIGTVSHRGKRRLKAAREIGAEVAAILGAKFRGLEAAV